MANTSLEQVFESKRKKSSRKAGTFKCTASEGLSLYLVVAMFTIAVALRDPQHPCRLACLALVALCDLVDKLHAVPLGVVTPDMLRQAVQAFLEACEAAGWTSHLHSKFHWLVHIPIELLRFGMLCACFVHERKHRMVKRYSNDVQNTRAFERSVLSEVLSHHFTRLRKPDTFSLDVGLVDPRPASKQLLRLLNTVLLANPPLVAEDVKASRMARLSSSAIIYARDICLVTSEDGRSLLGARVHANVHIEDVGCLTMLSFMTRVSSTALATTWRVDPVGPTLVPTSDIIAPCIYSESAGTVRTLIPWHLRSRLA